MSTTTQSHASQDQSPVADLDRQLNEQILKGDILGAFDKFYAEDVVMQENLDEPTAGKPENRKREEDFMASVEAFHGAVLLSSAIGGDVAFSEWEFDFTPKGGERVKFTQVAVRRWKRGQVAHERFYYPKH
jgi:ketosteroid isomerase-like protein